MLKVESVNRGPEGFFEETLEKRGVEYSFVGTVKPFIGTIGAIGGSKFDVYDYIRAKDNQRILVGVTGFGSIDYVTEEVYVIPIDDDSTYELEEVGEAIQAFINKEEIDQLEREKKRSQVKSQIRSILDELDRKEVVKGEEDEEVRKTIKEIEEKINSLDLDGFELKDFKVNKYQNRVSIDINTIIFGGRIFFIHTLPYINK